ncbi:type II toxin-antitoxin system Phd/YefM family antitoxin [Protofrankia sp. BMG5.30]|nr:type II toxin-antitoxin system prevent-host-death family antitoxin [Protofrankia sp. BMG5.30]
MFYTGPMRQVGVRELNQNTSQVIERVRRGETVEVTDRGHPVARLVPVERELSVLERLVAEGQATAPSVQVGEPLSMPPVLGDPAVDTAAELAAAREDENW